MKLTALASQTVGPFFNFALTTNRNLGVLAQPHAKGEHIRLTLRLLDGAGTPVGDGMLELWQADANGVYRHPNDPRAMDADPAFYGFGRLETDGDGYCIFETVRPGRVPNGGDGSAHINVIVFSRGLLHHLFTRIYFEDDATLDSDPALAIVPAERRATLIARPGSAAGEWTHDIRLQGEGETVFFDI
jgi:protocatechuate 3,4-dioxygenase alpha subunit